MVVNGAGAAGIACAELLNALGMPKKILLCVILKASFIEKGQI